MLRTALPLFTLLALSASPAQARQDEPPCREPAGTHVWWSPLAPIAGTALRILVVSEDVREGEVHIALPGKAGQGLTTSKRGGPPFSFAADVKVSTAGTVRIELRRTGQTVACRNVTVATRKPTTIPTRTERVGAWQATQDWSPTTENFFSAWIERMFDAPSDAPLGFPSLAPVLHDPTRNFLWGYLGLREDDAKNREIPRAVPDCADLPYYLRAYFAWKMALPFALRDCDRGKSERPPKCGPILHNEEAIDGRGALERFRNFLRILANKVHSGSARTALDDDETDFYPVALQRSSLRPGTIYADPYGHVLMIAGWVDQTPDHGGLLFAVDGQPDNSIGRKRFWEGTFLFANDLASAGPGFKAFRPILRTPKSDTAFAPLSNRALRMDSRFAPFSTEQSTMDRDAFYARMAKIINPAGLDAKTAYAETMNALVEQLTTRVGSVDNGERAMRESNDRVVPMPVGPKIFETVGPWEDYATPSRDMRLLIALRVLTGLPERIVDHPELFILGSRKPTEVRKDIEALHEQQIGERSIEYRRSDGSTFRLRVADILARKSTLEMAYNPNDCVEIRWGASEKTPDFSTCKRHAPDEQRTRMEEYRGWFREARRPPR